MSSIILGPSTIASQFWCEMAVDLRRQYGEVQTPEKEKGSEIHKDRFLEVLEEIVVEIKTPADKLHSNVHNMNVELDLYQKEGLTRELPILSKFKNALIKGIIDEIKLVEEVEGLKTYKRTQIIEMKTRKSQNPPSSQQIIKDKMQGMIYWYVLNAMINGKTEMGDFWSAYGVDLIEPDFNEIILSEEYMESLEIPKNEQKEIGTLLGVGTLITEVIHKFKELPELSRTIEIIYINQKTLTEVHREKYKFDERFFTRGMEWALEYWSGKRSPTSVGEANNWKCNFCGYYTLCPAIHKKWKQGD
ncbi:MULTISPECIES: PD-(D/E)XK nuclease family protein [Methanobacterium]|uniref:PD-(D/E)XK nuclease family protein n=1 Tax=Methanobacterium veterum TaxID=408577 RepID=A0A9E5DHN6_9EURY|nr:MULTISPECIES: PD-(D/E)XK nuclease family protein [Methanobacterium]MCZ3364302.1 PD-(D/E)XK nuclease family protein [Methanobacterium veterum]MCZ3372050.1 PD-(D/E)XK nuclease family protein [Methanobacterium veterum]